MRTVELSGTELRIDGVPRVLLCASLFPFRVPREQWRDRLDAVARLGYHAVDVYVPWNFHETEPGQWDFTGQRDLDHFLRLAGEAGLLVLARPGPYICSEWDGGALPAWLSLDGDLRLRQNEPRYLAEVDRWYAQVVPILARHQYPTGGPVVLVQVENELDFFDCDDPAGYLDALAGSARRHGITVPLVACAGQGDIARAAGGLADVVAAVNLYPSDDAPDMEQHAAYFEAALRKQDLPMLVTETNRLHRTLKRLLACGVRLLGPYLQASGWNGEYGTAVNNWGDLLGFMTHDYDFGGVLDPTGAERADAAEARRLAALVDALGPRLAAAVPAGPVTEAAGDLTVVPYALDLAGGGQLLSLTNLADVDATARNNGLPVTVPAGTCLLVLRDLPLTEVGARLTATDAELTGLVAQPGSVRVTVASRGPATLLLAVTGAWSSRADGDAVAGTSGPGTVRITGTAGSVRLTTPAGTVTVGFAPAEPPPAPPAADRSRTVTAVLAGTDDGDPTAWTATARRTPALPLERLGVYRGAGRYRITADLRDVCGLVLRAAADVVDVRVDRTALGWTANGGGDLWVPFTAPVTHPGTEVAVTARIWGHTNFDDSRLPSLRLGSLRGVAGVLAVTDVTDLSTGWLVGSWGQPAVGAGLPPRGDLGGWMSSRFPQTMRYRRTVEWSGTAALRAEDGQARLDVAVNGTRVGTLTPLTPVLWLGDLHPGDELTVDVHRTWGEPVGRLSLLRGRVVDDWDVTRQATGELLASRRQAQLTSVDLPLVVPAGQARWLHLPAEEPGDATTDLTVRFAGTGLLATALSDGRNLGRVWIGGPPPGATLRGGRGDLLIVPGPWRHTGLDLYLEATTADAGHLHTIITGGPVDAPQEGTDQ
ncbi:beta-galactosidase [Micromonospora echinofusca]|uniref:Beta-galactosidase n=1 Tax=Micromonospora echinofusca TaxID=47858 RepID=A0ABS3VR53_MICEH|nr:beta-galactosidase [Micromonospora echinofusca]MBO4207002.1 beta-galactosidase [Micromonospora echinofusca]